MVKIFLITASLCMDSLAVASAVGTYTYNVTFSLYLRMSLLFSFTQTSLLLTGYFLGFTVGKTLNNLAHIISPLLISAIGIKMIIESFSDHKIKKSNSIKLIILFSLAIFTSIDALAVGGSFGLIKSPLLISASFLFTQTIIAVIIGLSVGHKFGQLPAIKAELTGGIILILLAIITLLNT